MTAITLTDEQQELLGLARQGQNVLVEACIGSGKTTAIQELCREMADKKRILYLTYNRLLKIEAKAKIHQTNITVTNYHGFAWQALKQIGISVGVPDTVQTFLSRRPPIRSYDLLVIDEYQDIDLEISEMLSYIKDENPNIQIIAVGDMDQKIYDKTTLNVSQFIHAFLGKYTVIEFTRCFRLNAAWASKLGFVWGKEIRGVNENCTVESLDAFEVVELLSKYEPGDILCLGSRNGMMASILNDLEDTYPEKFNKKTVYASIKDRDSGASQPDETVAVFTTYDSSKGMERKICVVFDFTESFWQMRLSMPQQSYKILRNIFCVAASRGKEKIIFVKTEETPLSTRSLAYNSKSSADKYQDVAISEMFDFKYKEDIEACFSLLDIEGITDAEYGSIIETKTSDALIDLSPCVGIFLEANFFKNYNINEEIELSASIKQDKKYMLKGYKRKSLSQKILLLTALETGQNRYLHQVKPPFVTQQEADWMKERLRTQFKATENVQCPCEIEFRDPKTRKSLFCASGLADVVKNGVVHELKFVTELTHEHFLQCASYIVALGLTEGILWNVRNNSRYHITIPNKKKFMDQVARTVTKGKLAQYRGSLRL